MGLHAALDYLDNLGIENIHAHDTQLVQYAKKRLGELKDTRIFGPKEEQGGLVSFVFKEVHALDLATMANQQGIAIRIGHHCTQPLHDKLGVPATARASFYFYNTQSEVDRFIEVLHKTTKLLG